MYKNPFIFIMAFAIICIVPNTSTLQESASTYKPTTLHLKDLTWPQIVIAINNGYQSVLVPTGGIEQNGHHMITGKHDYIVQYASQMIASELDDTLIAPVVSFVPEGSFEPKTENMKFPGTIGISEQAFSLLLEGIARSLKNTGFKQIYFLGDHGGSIATQEQVASKLSQEWLKDQVSVHSISTYYHAGDQQQTYLLSQGYSPSQIGDHAGMLDTSELMFINPTGVNLYALNSNSLPQYLRGDSGSAHFSSADIGKLLIKIKVQAAIAQIKLSRK